MRKFLPIAIIILGLIPTTTRAQWVSFTDETSTRLVLRPFVDDRLSDPYLDAMEKDVAVGDLDQDGDMDAIVVRKLPFSEIGPRQDCVLINHGGRLVDRTAMVAPDFVTGMSDARDVIIGKFTADGYPDVVVCNTFGQQPKFFRNRAFGRPPGNSGTLRIPVTGRWRGLVDESEMRFPEIRIPQDVTTRQFCAVAAGDVDGDGTLDLYFSNYDPDNPTDDVLLINNGRGFFTNETSTRLGNLSNVSFGTSVEIKDVDNDGDNDIVKTTTLYEAPPFEVGEYILYNDGNGTFSRIQKMPVEDPYMFTLADFDGNGLLDHYMVDDEQDRVSLAQSVNSAGNVVYTTYELTGSDRTQEFGGNVKVADIDGDGDLDVGVCPIDVDIENCDTHLGFALLRNDGTGILRDPYNGQTKNFNLGAHDFDYIDINGDGKLDLFMTLCEGWRVLIQD